MTSLESSDSEEALPASPLPRGLVGSLGGYTFLQRLPCSDSHEAFVARCEASGSRVHIGVYALERLRADARLRERVERRALLSRAAPHPHLVRGVSSFLSDSDLFLVEEFCPGGELLDAVDRFYRGAAPVSTRDQSGRSSARMPLSVVRRAGRELLGAVQHLHRVVGAAHRGIKLESIFLDAENRMKLGRMSVGAAIPRGAGDGRMRLCCASKLYAAPEIVMGHPYSGEHIDVWAAGVVLFVMLTGRFPFEEDEADAELLLERICTADEVLLAHPALAQLDDPQAVDLLRGMLHTDAKCRLTVNEVLAHPFLATTAAES